MNRVNGLKNMVLKEMKAGKGFRDLTTCRMMDIPANAKYVIIRETSLRTDNLLSIKQLCSLAGVSRSRYYRYLGTEEDRQRREWQDQEDFRQIVVAYQLRG